LQLTTAEQRKFWETISNDDRRLNKDSYKSCVIDTLVKQRIDERKMSISGRYLPLSVWAKKGFNTKNIEDNTPAQDARRLSSNYVMMIAARAFFWFCFLLIKVELTINIHSKMKGQRISPCSGMDIPSEHNGKELDPNPIGYSHEDVENI